jgi:hypothetical protein
LFGLWSIARNGDQILGEAIWKSQRDFDLQPKVARNELPWVWLRKVRENPKGVSSAFNIARIEWPPTHMRL